MQIIETQAFSIEEVARMFNIAPHKIKALQQSTNNNIEQQKHRSCFRYHPAIYHKHRTGICKSYSLN
jgi:hypothetical protein